MKSSRNVDLKKFVYKNKKKVVLKEFLGEIEKKCGFFRIFVMKMIPM